MAQFEYDGRGIRQDGWRASGHQAQPRMDRWSYDRSQAYTMTLSYDDQGLSGRDSPTPTATRPGWNTTPRATRSRREIPVAVDAAGIRRRSRLTRSPIRWGIGCPSATTTVTTWYPWLRPRGQPATNTTSSGISRVVDPLGHATGYDYDALGRLTAVTEPSGSVTRYEYDTCREPDQILYPNGAEQRYEYDVRGRLISEAYP